MGAYPEHYCDGTLRTHCIIYSYKDDHYYTAILETFVCTYVLLNLRESQ